MTGPQGPRVSLSSYKADATGKARSDQGPIGLTGQIGLTGPKGIMGVPGEKGDKGDRGEKGIQVSTWS